MLGLSADLQCAWPSRPHVSVHLVHLFVIDRRCTSRGFVSVCSCLSEGAHFWCLCWNCFLTSLGGYSLKLSRKFYEKMFFIADKTIFSSYNFESIRVLRAALHNISPFCGCCLNCIKHIFVFFILFISPLPSVLQE